MPYATVQDLQDRFGEREIIELTDPDAQAVQSARAEQALADAAAFADGFLGRVYQLPLAGCVKPAPTELDPHATERVPAPQLVRIVCDVARYYLYDDLAPEAEVYRRFKNAERELRAIADGDAVLVCPWGGEPGELTTAGPLGGDTWHDFARRAVSSRVEDQYR